MNVFINILTSTANRWQEQLHFTVSPNPSSGDFQVQFQLEKTEPVTLAVLDLAGREVAVLLEDKPLPPGSHAYRIEAAAWPAGIYFFCLKTVEGRVVRRAVRMR